MKRIICLLTAVAFGAAGLVANEPKLILNARTSANLVTVDLDEESNNLGLSLGGNDTFGLEFRGENAGARITLNGNLSTGAVAIDEYRGWMKFDALNLTAGRFNARYANAVTADASSWATFEQYRYGAIRNGTLLFESDNIAQWNQSEFTADYTLGNFFAAAGTGTNTAASVFHIQDQWAGRIAYTIKDIATINVNWAQLNNKALDLNQSSVGAFLNLMMVENLTAVVGYSGYHVFDEVELNVFAAELRARYVLDSLSITSHNNASFGFKTTTLYNMANIAFKINDYVTTALYASNVNISGNEAGTAKRNTVVIRPGITLMAQRGATIDAGLQFTFNDREAATDTRIMTFPVTFRVRF